jgi:hypothetical protein
MVSHQNSRGYDKTWIVIVPDAPLDLFLELIRSVMGEEHAVSKRE